MKKFAVSHIDWYDYVLVTKIVEAQDWKSALSIIWKEKLGEEYPMPESLEECRQAAFDVDSMIEVVEVK